MLFEKFVPSMEINSMKNNVNAKSEGAEIFSAICRGKDLTKYGNKVDKVVAYIKTIGDKALNGDLKAMAEINAYREIQIQEPLIQRLNLFGYMGDYQSVPFNTELRYKVAQLQGKKSGEQANSGSFAFPVQTWREGTFSTKTISGGMAIDYRQEATMNTDSIARANEQVLNDMFNQMFYDVVFNMYTSIRTMFVGGAAITAFTEAAGITQASVDDAIRLMRRWGAPTISGDYSVISQLEPFAGFTTVAGTVQYSEAVMEEIRKTGLLKSYRGVPIVELPNAYNTTNINATAGIGGAVPFYETYLPEGLLFVLPKVANGSPLQVGIKGGVQSQTGQDLNLRLNVTRFDIEFGSTIINDLVPMMSLISDSNFIVDKR